jgi:VWFA-related protein
MQRFLAFLGFSMICALSLETLANAQQSENRNTPAAPPTQQSAATIRSTTRLVQVSVVVTDKKGEPITGLKKEDFSIFDDSNQQQIAFFSEATPAPVAPVPPLPKNVFTNRFDLKGQDPGAVTVILFDSLNTSSQDQAYVREQVIKFLKSLKPQDHVAIYALTTQLLILHEFTQDASALVNAASQFMPKETAAYDASNPEYFDVAAFAGDPSWQKFQASVNGANARIAEQAKANRAETTTEAFAMIANHVAAIPGRKSLVWVSGSFPLRISLGTLNVRGSEIQELAKQAARALNRANMAIYPVDATGVAVDTSMTADKAGNPVTLACMDCVNQAPYPSPGMQSRRSNLDAERMLAEATGGQPFYGSNDIVAAMKRTFGDGRFAYTIGFYPSHGQWDGKYRKIAIRTDAKGAQLRYRTGYFAEAESANADEARAAAAMREAAMSPLDATGLGMIVTGKLAGAPADRKIELHVGLDPKQLLLQTAGNRQKGAVDLYFVQSDAKGQTVAAGKQRIALDLEEKQYEYLAKTGIVLAWHLTISPSATQVRLLARDAGSETLGSVTMPVQALLEAPGSSAAPVSQNLPN